MTTTNEILMRNEIEAAMAEALEAVEKEQAHQQAKAHGEPLEPAVVEPEILDADTLESAPDDPKDAHQEPSSEEPESTEEPAGPGAAELKDQLMRLAADFENFKKRTRREKEDIRKFANEQLLKDILPALDNVNRALEHVEDRDNPLVQGIEMVAKQFLDILGGYGVSTVDSKGKPFDPALHDAMGQTPSSDVEPGCVVNEFEKGYLIHGKLLRPAKVIVATAPVAAVKEATLDTPTAVEHAPEQEVSDA